MLDGTCSGKSSARGEQRSHRNNYTWLKFPFLVPTDGSQGCPRGMSDLSEPRVGSENVFLRVFIGLEHIPDVPRFSCQVS